MFLLRSASLVTSLLSTFGVGRFQAAASLFLSSGVGVFLCCSSCKMVSQSAPFQMVPRLRLCCLRCLGLVPSADQILVLSVGSFLGSGRQRGLCGVGQCFGTGWLGTWWVDSQRGSIVLGPGFGTRRWFLHSAMAAPRVARRVSPAR